MQRPLNMTGSHGGASEHESYFQHTGFRCWEDRPKREMMMRGGALCGEDEGLWVTSSGHLNSVVSLSPSAGPSLWCPFESCWQPELQCDGSFCWQASGGGDQGCFSFLWLLFFLHLFPFLAEVWATAACPVIFMCCLHMAFYQRSRCHIWFIFYCKCPLKSDFESECCFVNYQVDVPSGCCPIKANTDIYSFSKQEKDYKYLSY